MKVSFPKFSQTGRATLILAEVLKNLRGQRFIDEEDLTVASLAFESPAKTELEKIGISFHSLTKQIIPLDLGDMEIFETLTSSRDSFDDYNDFTPSASFIVKWAPNLAFNTALRNFKEKSDGENPLGNPVDLIVKPEHILFIALSNKNGKPSRLIEKVYEGVDSDPIRTIKEGLGFKGCDVTNQVSK